MGVTQGKIKLTPANKPLKCLLFSFQESLFHSCYCNYLWKMWSMFKACLECVRTWNQINVNVMQVQPPLPSFCLPSAFPDPDDGNGWDGSVWARTSRLLSLTCSSAHANVLFSQITRRTPIHTEHVQTAHLCKSKKCRVCKTLAFTEMTACRLASAALGFRGLM